MGIYTSQNDLYLILTTFTQAQIEINQINYLTFSYFINNLKGRKFSLALFSLYTHKYFRLIVNKFQFRSLAKLEHKTVICQ